MSAQEGAHEAATVRLSDDDFAYVLNLLRNASQPVTTQQLIDALRRQSGSAAAEPGESE
jgi:hypothetical protein